MMKMGAIDENKSVMPDGVQQRREAAQILQNLRSSSPSTNAKGTQQASGVDVLRKRKLENESETAVKSNLKALPAMTSFDWSKQSKSSPCASRDSATFDHHYYSTKRLKTSTAPMHSYVGSNDVPFPRQDPMQSLANFAPLESSRALEQILRAQILQRQLNLLQLSNAIRTVAATANVAGNATAKLDMLHVSQEGPDQSVDTKKQQQQQQQQTQLCLPVGQSQAPASIHNYGVAAPTLLEKKVKICRMDGCDDPAAKRTPYCSNHAGPRKCEGGGCSKFAQGRTRFCIAHGGGRRCKFAGCTKSARDKQFCASHGGGKRCSTQNCTKLAVGSCSKCTAHGGGKRCQAKNCTKGAQSSFKFCVQHGGGRRCSVEGCTKVARGKMKRCMSHSMI